MYVKQFLELRNAKIYNEKDWEKIEPGSVFKDENGVAYYKKNDGKIVTVEKLANFFLAKKQQRNKEIKKNA